MFTTSLVLMRSRLCAIIALRTIAANASRSIHIQDSKITGYTGDLNKAANFKSRMGITFDFPLGKPQTFFLQIFAVSARGQVGVPTLHQIIVCWGCGPGVRIKTTPSLRICLSCPFSVLRSPSSTTNSRRRRLTTSDFRPRSRCTSTPSGLRRELGR